MTAPEIVTNIGYVTYKHRYEGYNVSVLDYYSSLLRNLNPDELTGVPSSCGTYKDLLEYRDTQLDELIKLKKAIR